MNKITLLFFLMIFITPIYSQNVFGEVGAYWKYHFYAHNGNGGGNDMIEVKGDTLINGKIFKIINSTQYRFTNFPFEEYYTSAEIGLMQVVGDSVFFNDELILDFGMELEDSMIINAPAATIQLAVDSIGMEIINGVDYKKWYGQQICISQPDFGSYEDFEILETIGGVGYDYLFWNTDGCIIGGGSRLFDCYRNGNFKYPIEIDCEPLLIVNTSAISQESNPQVFPNPFKDYIFLNAAVTAERTIQIFDFLGRQVAMNPTNVESCNIDTRNFKSGIYFISIKYADKIYIEKIVKK